MIHGTAVGRAALELTAGEVYGADLDMTNSCDGLVTVRVALTMGGLTEAWIRLYANDGATPTAPLYVNGERQSYRLTAATAATCFTVPVAGLRYFRASAQGDAGFAGSSCTIDYFYNDYTRQQSIGGEMRVH